MTTLELVDWKIVRQRTSLRGVRYEAERMPRSLAASVPLWARIVLRPRSSHRDSSAGWAPVFVSPRLIGVREADVLRHIPALWDGHFKNDPRRAWKSFGGHRYCQLDVLYAAFPERARRLERILHLAIEARVAERRAIAPMPPPVVKGRNLERHYSLAAAAYAVLATFSGHRVDRVQRFFVVCPRPDMSRRAEEMRVTFQNRRWQRLVQQEMMVDLACHVDERGRVRVAKPPPGAWHVNPRVNQHVGMLLGLDRHLVLERLTARTERLVALRWKTIEAVADRLAAKQELRGAEVRRIVSNAAPVHSR
ncbi:MAG: hypothetical protein KIT14_25755 [bacterium]|nr:hypothetical protein [bacterium]